MLKSKERFFLTSTNVLFLFAQPHVHNFFAYNLYLIIIHNICKNKSYYSMMKSENIYTLFKCLVEKCIIEYKRLK